MIRLFEHNLRREQSPLCTTPVIAGFCAIAAVLFVWSPTWDAKRILSSASLLTVCCAFIADTSKLN